VSDSNVIKLAQPGALTFFHPPRPAGGLVNGRNVQNRLDSVGALTAQSCGNLSRV
jgi:hypothetical protein